MFIGLGIGMYYGEIATGVLIGMGVGFIVMGIITMINGNKDSNQ